jgi:hypothetical protein
MAMLRVGGNNKNAKGREDALAQAQKKLTLQGHPGIKTGDITIVLLKPSNIGAIPEIFQPREFTFGYRDHDRIHIKALQQEIRIHKQLHPPLVIRLEQDGWVVAEGHHRIQAYIAEGLGDQEIECEWFYGMVREAADAGMERNNIVKLNIKQADRVEEAWKRVLLGWGSKAQIIKLCTVGDGTVGTLRRAMRLAQLLDEKRQPLTPEHEDFKDAVAFRKRLSGDYYGDERMKEDATPAETLEHLKSLTWGVVGKLYRGATKADFDMDEAAMSLTRELKDRLKSDLSKNPAVTARALQLLDPTLPDALMNEWGRPIPDPYKPTQGDEDL